MKKNLLALSIAAMVGGLSGVANAAVGTDTVGARLISNTAAFGKLPAPAAALAATTMSNSTTGIGHVLFVPYFTTQGTHATLLNLVNNDQTNGKAVKLRFRGAANSDDLFDITIYLSPGDVWAANVSANGELSALSTNDTSCTLPSIAQIKETAGKFSTNRVLNNAAAETREGYVEILNMADVVPGSALFTATKHVAGKAPCTQAVMDLQAKPLVANDAVNDPVTRGYSWPTGGLSANWTIVDVGTKASYSGEALAVRATPTATVNQAGAANLVFSPQTTERVINAATLTADPLLQLVNGPVRPASYDFPDLSTPYTAGSVTPEVQANELAAALETFSVSNEYITDPVVSFATDWVFSMPTRRYAVALNYETKAMVFNNGVARNFTAANTSLNKDKTRICVDAGQLVAFDREEQSRTSFVISPDDILKFCGETSVLSFNGKESVLNAKLAVNNVPTTFTDGWLNIGTSGLGNGLPIVGYAVGKAVGPTGSNFGGTWMHRNNRFGNQPF
ncbi:MAG: cell surface protein [Rhodoferax sp.]|nr:cell surface protein [Rhodoferax sp.]